MEREQAMVREFQRAFDHPVNDRPAKLTPDRVRARAGWMHEEVREFENASTLDEQVDAVIDLMYFALGTMVELGVDGAPVFEIVHRANMTKLGPDGKPMFRKGDRKVTKPDSWVDPKAAVAGEIRRQQNESRPHASKRSA